MPTMIRPSNLTRADLLDLLWEFNVDAKAIARRGRCGTASVEYADCHEAINDALDRLGL